ncbi:MAG: (d)CMP kinase [Chromatiales bacterium]|nr:(d)CMP kinase [Chromatiales bacterium]
MSMVITVDGPSGVGKGTMSQMLADKLGWHLLDSGALYRITAFAATEKGVGLEDEAAVADIARNLDVIFRSADGGVKVELSGQDISGDIRTETAGNNASIVAVLPAVRDALLQRQRDFATESGLVADGRDMGTTVFPKAPLKFYLTASPEVRAERRYNQLKEKGLCVSVVSLAEEIRERDERDSNRAASPLKPADDAVVVDTSSMSIDKVFQQMVEKVQSVIR